MTFKDFIYSILAVILATAILLPIYSAYVRYMMPVVQRSYVCPNVGKTESLNQEVIPHDAE